MINIEFIDYVAVKCGEDRWARFSVDMQRGKESDKRRSLFYITTYLLDK